jgi:isoleucyl-tRNA synthetase
VLKIGSNLLVPHLLLEKATGGEVFREILNVSGVDIEAIAGPEHNIVDEVTVIPANEAGRTKCERCWHWETDVGANSEHPTICGRCVEAVKQFKA